MLKNILKLEGASVLNTNEKKSLKGGYLTQACEIERSSGCTPSTLSGCIKVGGDYNSTCRCCYLD